MLKKLNPLLHSELRLAIVSFLVAHDRSDFNELKEITGATSGNLSIQLKKLQEAKYVILKKSFKDNYPHTAVRISQNGIKAFESYVEVLKQYIN